MKLSKAFFLASIVLLAATAVAQDAFKSARAVGARQGRKHLHGRTLQRVAPRRCRRFQAVCPAKAKALCPLATGADDARASST